MADQLGLVAPVRWPCRVDRSVAKCSGGLLHLYPPALVRVVDLSRLVWAWPYGLVRPVPDSCSGSGTGAAATQSGMTRRGIVALIIVIGIDVASMYWIARHLAFS